MRHPIAPAVQAALTSGAITRPHAIALSWLKCQKQQCALLPTAKRVPYSKLAAIVDSAK